MKKRVKKPQNSKSSDSYIQNIKTLQKNEKKFRTIFENANDIILYVDKYGKITDVNNKIKDILGYKRKEVLGKNFAETGTLSLTEMPKMIKLFLKSVRKKSVLGGGQTNIMEMKLKHKNGKMIDIEGSTQIIKKDGKLDGFLSILRDVSIRKKAEDELRKSEKRFKDLILSSVDWLWEVDKDGKYTFASAKVKTILGYSPEELIGKTPFDLMSKEEAKKIGKIFKKITSKKKQIVDLEKWNLTKNGEKVCLLTNAIPLLDEKGNLIGYRGLDKDITKQMKAQKVLEHFKSAVDTSSDAIGMSTPDGKHFYQNKAFDDLFGDIGNDPPGSVYVDEKVGREVFETIMTGDVWNGEVEMYGKGKKILNILLRAYSIKDSDGKILGLVGVHTDITKRKKAEDEMKKARDDLAERVEELERFSKIAIGRELRMVELKKKIKKLKGRLKKR